VQIAYRERQLELTISNSLPAGAHGEDQGGHGILGMRERAALLGGTLQAASSDGCFRVRARLPYVLAENPRR
jgi:signal transduction histidine kinase